jgi:hypothetical protein
VCPAAAHLLPLRFSSDATYYTPAVRAALAFASQALLTRAVAPVSAGGMVISLPCFASHVVIGCQRYSLQALYARLASLKSLFLLARSDYLTFFL